MNRDELAREREKHLAHLQEMRALCVAWLSSDDPKMRRAAGPRLRRVDARIRAMGGTPGEQEDDEGDELLGTLMAPAQPGRRHMLYG